jgi:hypothetical protein
MALNKGKHNIVEIEGVRCTLVETGLTEARALFLKNLLELNGYGVKMEKEKAKDGSETGAWQLGVTDILFNPVIALYAQKLHREDQKIVTQAYWNQWPVDPDVPYWMVTI